MKTAILGLAALFAAAAASAQHVPAFTQGLVDLQARTQLIATLDSLDLLAEGLGQLNDADLHFGYRSLTLGAYYRVLPNLKLGAFYRLQAGARHDDDVTASTVTQGWSWADTTGRLENVFMADASPRFLLPFLPGRDWVLMVKSRFLYNTFNDQASIMARPELTYFWIVDRVPILNASLSYEMYFPLNFGTTLIYEGYPYLTVLWHATPEVGIELSGAYKTTVWSTSREPGLAAGMGHALQRPVSLHVDGVPGDGAHAELLRSSCIGRGVSALRVEASVRSMPSPTRMRSSGHTLPQSTLKRNTAVTASSTRPPMRGPRDAAVNRRSLRSNICHAVTRDPSAGSG